MRVDNKEVVINLTERAWAEPTIIEAYYSDKEIFLVRRWFVFRGLVLGTASPMTGLVVECYESESGRDEYIFLNKDLDFVMKEIEKAITADTPIQIKLELYTNDLDVFYKLKDLLIKYAPK